MNKASRFGLSGRSATSHACRERCASLPYHYTNIFPNFRIPFPVKAEELLIFHYTPFLLELGLPGLHSVKMDVKNIATFNTLSLCSVPFLSGADLHEAPALMEYSDPGKAQRLLEAREALIDLDERNRETFPTRRGCSPERNHA